MNDEDILISAYTRADAIADGVLVDVTETARDAGFRVPVAITAAAWATCVEIPQCVSCQDEAGRLWDMLTMLGHACRRLGGDESVRMFDVLVLNEHTTPKPVRLKVICGPGDDETMCLTVMLPEED